MISWTGCENSTGQLERRTYQIPELIEFLQSYESYTATESLHSQFSSTMKVNSLFFCVLLNDCFLKTNTQANI